MKKEHLTKEEKKQQAKAYCDMIEAKLRKSEKTIWFIKDHDKLDGSL